MERIKEITVWDLETAEQGLGRLAPLARLDSNYYKLYLLGREGKKVQEIIRYEDLIVHIIYSDEKPTGVVPIFPSPKSLKKYLNRLDIYP